MKRSDHEETAERLAGLLRQARPASPTLPPRFQENVWRRLEAAEARPADAPEGGWLDALVLGLLRPRLIFAMATVVLLAGLALGWNSGEHQARLDSQARYVSAVAPTMLR